MPDEWVTIKKPTRDDALQAYAGTKLSWLVRFEMRCSDDTMRILPAADWRSGPDEFVNWLAKHASSSNA